MAACSGSSPCPIVSVAKDVKKIRAMNWLSGALRISRKKSALENAARASLTQGVEAMRKQVCKVQCVFVEDLARLQEYLETIISNLQLTLYEEIASLEEKLDESANRTQKIFDAAESNCTGIGQALWKRHIDKLEEDMKRRLSTVHCRVDDRKKEILDVHCRIDKRKAEIRGCEENIGDINDDIKKLERSLREAVAPSGSCTPRSIEYDAGSSCSDASSKDGGAFGQKTCGNMRRGTPVASSKTSSAPCSEEDVGNDDEEEVEDEYEDNDTYEDDAYYDYILSELGGEDF